MSGGGIALQDVTVAYDRHAAVHHVSGRFVPGSMTAIVGPNGAGKSTLLKAIVGEARQASGTITLEGVERSAIGYLPQVVEIDRSFPISVADTILLGAWRRSGAFRRIPQDLRERGREALATVGLDGFGDRPVGALSAGQFRRVLFARLLLQDSQLILLDEPFAAIDARTTGDLLALVSRWHQGERTIIAVLHDFDQVRAHFPQTLLLAREAIAWGETRTALNSENLLRARAMSEDWDDAAELCGDGHRHVA